ncbi:hypothetical protein PQR02_17425 [Paraburkholderia sediminicola]|uniref:Uncharacterized protein n=1 Tax=Paraburkholderia rhynchosiae TaxID=487049 RepID=A0ACC7N7U4_9BURK
MSPFSLIEVTQLHSRAGITRNSHFGLNPLRLFSALRKLFASRPPACDCR